MPNYNDDNMSQYSQTNVMTAYVSMIKFALEQLELRLDELGDDILFEGMSPFPEDVLGDDSLFAGYTNPWSPDDECDCEECRCDSAANRIGADAIMRILKTTRKPPQD